jgi:UDP-N-acetylglucosamine acyltransferase
MIEVHKTAQVDPGARIGEGTTIGPFSVVGGDVTLGEDCQLGPHVVVHGKVTMGHRNRITSNAAIGGPPQDLKYGGEPTELVIGSDNLFREFVTVNRGTVGGGGVTRVGSRCMFMAYSHVAHDCEVGDHVIFANGGTLAGHVHVGSHSTIGAFTAIHQFCRVGEYAFVGGFSVLTKDVLPFVKTVGARGEAQIYGINTIGLERKGFSAEAIEALKNSYRTLFMSKKLLQEALAEVEEREGHHPEVAYLIQFIRESKRGIQR